MIHAAGGVVAAAGSESAIAFIEIGAVALILALFARVAGRLGITAIPLYLLAGLAVGDGGLVRLDISEDFISLAAEIGVLLLLLTLGLEYSADELRGGLRTGAVPGLVDAIANFLPGLGMGLLLGWEPTAAVLLGGVTWISSSGVISKVLADLGRLGNRETPSILNILVIEDLAMAVYLPIAAALVAGHGAILTATTVAVALTTAAAILVVALRYGTQLSAVLAPGNNESLLLAVFGLTLLVGGLVERLNLSSAIGAFLVGLALSGPVQQRAEQVIAPLRDLFAGTFFLFFSFQIDPATLGSALVPAFGLAVITGGTKMLTGRVSAGRAGAGPRGRRRAGAALIARGEFSVVIASLGAGLVDGQDLGAFAAAYVLMTAIGGPLAAKYIDRPVAEISR